MCSTQDPPRFAVEHRFDEDGKRGPTESLVALFRRYSFDTFVFAIDPTTNRSVPIAMFGILDTAGDFVIRSHDTVDTSTFAYDFGNGTTEIESRALRGEITQSAIAKAFAICLFLVNWTLTVGSVYITALVVSRMLDANSMVAALPFSAPLTIPMVRSLYVDPPPLGTSVGQSYIPAVPFRGLTDYRCGSIFRADSNRRIMLLGLVRSPHGSPTPTTAPN